MTDDLAYFFGNLDEVQKRAVEEADGRLFKALVMTRLNEINGRVARTETRSEDHGTRLTIVEQKTNQLGILATAAGVVSGFFTGLFSKG